MVSKYYQNNTGLTVTNIYYFIIIISVIINIMPQALFVDLKLNTLRCFKAHSKSVRPLGLLLVITTFNTLFKCLRNLFNLDIYILRL